MPFGIGKKKAPDQGLDWSQILQAYPIRNPLVTTKVNEKGLVEVEVPAKKRSVCVAHRVSQKPFEEGLSGVICKER